jgi:alpha-L-rhamnosidase
LTLAAVPASYPVRVSADNRFILYVNGHRVGDGPARGDLAHWRYERFDLAPLLQPGKNLITATVWNFGVYAPLAQISDRTAFLLESEAKRSGFHQHARGLAGRGRAGPAPAAARRQRLLGVHGRGTGEEIDGARYDWSWNAFGCWTSLGSCRLADPREHLSDGEQGALAGCDRRQHLGAGSGCAAGDGVCADQSRQNHQTTYRVDSPIDLTGSQSRSGFQEAPVTVPGRKPRSSAPRPQDPDHRLSALTVSGGKGAKIRLTYAEALYDKDQHKGDRDEIGDRKALGLTDSFLPDGGAHRVFEPLWWRTWRYLDLDIETGSEPLTLESLTANFTAYPFEERASFNSGDPSWTRSGRSVGAPPGSTPTKPTWTRPTTSSSSTWATPASRRSSPTPWPATTGWPGRRFAAFDQSRTRTASR